MFHALLAAEGVPAYAHWRVNRLGVRDLQDSKGPAMQKRLPLFLLLILVSRISAASGQDRSAAPPPAVAPFNAEQARQHQAAWAEHLGQPVEIANSIGMKFRLIPPGEFKMSSEEPAQKEADYFNKRYSCGVKAEAYASENPAHKARITN